MCGPRWGVSSLALMWGGCHHARRSVTQHRAARQLLRVGLPRRRRAAQLLCQILLLPLVLWRWCGSWGLQAACRSLLLGLLPSMVRCPCPCCWPLALLHCGGSALPCLDVCCTRWSLSWLDGALVHLGQVVLDADEVGPPAGEAQHHGLRRDMHP